MQNPEFRFGELLQEIAEIYNAKRHDYGHGGESPLGNLMACERLGINPYLGVLVRLQDKFARLESLMGRDPKVATESILDTHKDIAIYSLLAIILWEIESDAPRKGVALKDNVGP